MENLWNFFLGYLVGINFLSVIVCIFDKYRARKHGWRVKESTLLWLSALGGSLGMYCTMKLIRHKTQHKKFMIGIPAIIAAQILLAAIFYYLLAAIFYYVLTNAKL